MSNNDAKYDHFAIINFILWKTASLTFQQNAAEKLYTKVLSKK